MKHKIIYQGAEAFIILKDKKIYKRRNKKSYRIQEIDEKLRKLRTRAEAKIMEKLQEKINVPKILKIDEKEKEIVMQYIEGKKLSEFLDNLKSRNEIMEQVGEEVSKIHNSDIIHGDLTTSNMILVEEPVISKNKLIKNKKTHNQTAEELVINDKKNIKVYIIDFGLSFHSSRIEDKACDLHLLKQALEAKHFLHWKNLFERFLSGYNPKDREKILNQLKKVEARGRYKS